MTSPGALDNSTYSSLIGQHPLSRTSAWYSPLFTLSDRASRAGDAVTAHLSPPQRASSSDPPRRDQHSGLGRVRVS